MVHHQAALFHRAEQGFAVLGQVGVAHVFEHANADDFIESTVLRQIAVIEQLQFNQVLQTFSLDPLSRQRQLFLAERDTKHLRPELAGRIARQPPPTAADIQKILAGLQAQLAAQMAEFCLLSLLQGFAAGFEVSAGIRHVAVEPQLIKRVREVVMVGDCLGVSFFVVDGAHRLTVVALIEQRLAPFIADADHVTDRAFQLQFAFDERCSERVQAGMGELGNHLWVLDHNRDAGRRPQIEFMAVPESQA
ncbi:hypothetical protein D3C84_514550 [compost metagenome]